MTTTHTNNS